MSLSFKGPPDRLRIPLDDHRFSQVGRLSDGRQFMAFITVGLPDGTSRNCLDGKWHRLAVVHLFDATGNHLETKARLAGYDIEGRDIAGRGTDGSKTEED